MSSPSGTLVIDGSHGEGGGQILRTALSLSAITGRTAEIVAVRAQRTPPGLKPQHLAAVSAAAAICAAELDGAFAGSERLVFAPRSPPIPGAYHFDIGTAGAATLVLQTLLPPLTLGGVAEESRVVVTGGTHVPHAPAYEYLEEVFAASLRDIGLQARFALERAGYYPRGGGEITARFAPSRPRPVDWTRRPGRMPAVTAHIVTSGLPEHVAGRGETAVAELLRQRNAAAARVVHHTPPSLGQGAAVTLVAASSVSDASDPARGFTAVGERGKPMERVARDACEQFFRWWKPPGGQWGAGLDEHLADQIALPLALTPGEHRYLASRVTDHLRSALHTIQQYLPIDYRIEEQSVGSLVTITVPDEVAALGR